MSVTLIAVVIALVVGHTMPALVALRRYDWFIRWLEWLSAQLGLPFTQITEEQAKALTK